MGLFKKKKDLELPSEPFEKEGATETTDFDKILAETPPSLQEPPIPGEEHLQEKELPAFEPSSEPQEEPEPPEPEATPEVGFDLPDFDDQEIEKIKAVKKAVEEAPKPKPKPILIPRRKPKPVLEPALEEPMEHPVEHPGPVRPMIKARQMFIDINNYLKIREEVSRIKALAGSTKSMIDRQVNTGRARDKRYEALVNILNTIQDKLIIIDNELFESYQDPEVNP